MHATTHRIYAYVCTVRYNVYAFVYVRYNDKRAARFRYIYIITSIIIIIMSVSYKNTI